MRRLFVFLFLHQVILALATETCGSMTGNVTTACVEIVPSQIPERGNLWESRDDVLLRYSAWRNGVAHQEPCAVFSPPQFEPRAYIYSTVNNDDKHLPLVYQELAAAYATKTWGGSPQHTSEYVTRIHVAIACVTLPQNSAVRIKTGILPSSYPKPRQPNHVSIAYMRQPNIQIGAAVIILVIMASSIQPAVFKVVCWPVVGFVLFRLFVFGSGLTT